jgi:hypothetical protein
MTIDRHVGLARYGVLLCMLAAVTCSNGAAKDQRLPDSGARGVDAGAIMTCSAPEASGECVTMPGWGENVCCPYLATHYDLVRNCTEPAGLTHRTYVCFPVHASRCAVANGPYCFAKQTQDGGVDLTQVYDFDHTYLGLSELGFVDCPEFLKATPWLRDGGGPCGAVP